MMVMMLAVLLVIATIIDADEAMNQDLCLASHHIDERIPDAIPYPNFYFPELFRTVNDKIPPPSSSKSMKCSVGMERTEEKNSPEWVKDIRAIGDDATCVSRMCPVKPLHVEMSMSELKFPYRADAICGIPFKKKVNVMVFGGSMTVGSRMCCDHTIWDLDDEGKQNTTCVNNPIAIYTGLDANKLQCSWSGYLLNWLATAYPNTKFEYHNMAVGGTSSLTMALEVVILLPPLLLPLLPLLLLLLLL